MEESEMGRRNTEKGVEIGSERRVDISRDDWREG